MSWSGRRVEAAPASLTASSWMWILVCALGAVEVEQDGVGAAAGEDLEARLLRRRRIPLQPIAQRSVEPGAADAGHGRAFDLERAAPGAHAARIVDRAEDLRRRLERHLQHALLAQRRSEIALRVDHLAVAHHVDAVDRRGAGDAEAQLAAIGRRLPRSHGLTVERSVDQQALARSRVGAQVAQRVEHGVVLVARREHRGEAARLRHRRLRRRCQARLRQMVVGAGDEADLEAVLQVTIGEPLEAAVNGVELDQPLELGIVLGPVAGHVGVRNDQHLFGPVAVVEAAVEIGEPVRDAAR